MLGRATETAWSFERHEATVFIYVTYYKVISIMYLAVSRSDEVSVKDPATLVN